MKVKIITSNTEYGLEEELNAFLSRMNDDNILDIKYQGIGCYSPYGTKYPSAMVIMKS